MNQQPTFFDNVNAKIVDDLKETIKSGSRVSIVEVKVSGNTLTVVTRRNWTSHHQL